MSKRDKMPTFWELETRWPAVSAEDHARRRAVHQGCPSHHDRPSCPVGRSLELVSEPGKKSYEHDLNAMFRKLKIN